MKSVLILLVGILLGACSVMLLMGPGYNPDYKAAKTTATLPSDLPISHFGDIWVVGDVKYELVKSTNNIDPSTTYFLHAYQGDKVLGPLASSDQREPLATIAEAMSEQLSRHEFFKIGSGADRYSSTTRRLFAGPKHGAVGDWWCMTYGAGDNLAAAVEGYWSRRGK
jgi:hypothetical protein